MDRRRPGRDHRDQPGFAQHDSEKWQWFFVSWERTEPRASKELVGAEDRTIGQVSEVPDDEMGTDPKDPTIAKELVDLFLIFKVRRQGANFVHILGDRWMEMGQRNREHIYRVIIQNLKGGLRASDAILSSQYWNVDDAVRRRR